MGIEDEILANPTLRNVQAKFQNQTAKGLAKYGETVNPASYDIVGWLNHLQQELIDGTVYAEVLIGEMSRIVEENKRLHEELAEAKEFADYKLQYSNQLLADLTKANEEIDRLREALEDIAARWQDVNEPQLTHLEMWNRAKEVLEESK